MQQNRAKTVLQAAVVSGGLLVTSAAAWAQTADAAVTGRSRPTLIDGIVSTLIFGFIGIILAIIGFKLFDAVIKANIEEEIFVNKNVAAALLAGSVVLGVSLIIGATLLS